MEISGNASIRHVPLEEEEEEEEEEEGGGGVDARGLAHPHYQPAQTPVRGEARPRAQGSLLG
ncbi:hypothetical protein EYF80_024711 [Liparis tanakae]|uniref:Uncharacterized protein n=1 Tax=Liparis tanakae TaxID=230148 RepID=A0A4Z2HJR6_9TELE|nr:hypothetical protein EYF80_024711 [Liparis tanakae]